MKIYNLPIYDKDNLSDSDKEELYAYANEVGLAEIVVYFLISALAMDVRYLQLLRGQINDTINNTDCYSNVGDINILTISANKIYVVGTFYFLWLNYSKYIQSLNSDEEMSEQINDWQDFIASLMIFIATVLSGSNLTL